jgi:hypothetical protein
MAGDDRYTQTSRDPNQIASSLTVGVLSALPERARLTPFSAARQVAPDAPDSHANVKCSEFLTFNSAFVG